MDSPADEDPTALPRGTETILLAEDQEELGRTARRILERHGYTVHVVPDGEAALQQWLADRDGIALIISDIKMPKLGGGELLKRVRALGGRTPFLLTSGYAEREVREDAGLDEAVAFLHKPWNMPELLQRVRRVLDAPGAT